MMGISQTLMVFFLERPCTAHGLSKSNDSQPYWIPDLVRPVTLLSNAHAGLPYPLLPVSLPPRLVCDVVETCPWDAAMNQHFEDGRNHKLASAFLTDFASLQNWSLCLLESL